MSTYSPTILVMIDGLRPDALDQIDCPNLRSLIARGASTLTARSVMPSVTLPCHTSIFHSVPPTRHGITVNVWTPMARPLPGLVDVAKDAGKRCSFIYNWEPLRDVSRPEKLYASSATLPITCPKGMIGSQIMPPAISVTNNQILLLSIWEQSIRWVMRPVG